jgi:putative FmdB family regulatory protein
VPLYEFRCRECGEKYELLCPGGFDDKGAACPSCGRTGTSSRQFSTFSARSVGGKSGGDLGGFEGNGHGSRAIGGFGGCGSCGGGSCGTCH